MMSLHFCWGTDLVKIVGIYKATSIYIPSWGDVTPFLGGKRTYSPTMTGIHHGKKHSTQLASH